MTHIRTVDTEFDYHDFARVLPRLIVPARREIFVNDARQIERLLQIVASSHVAALREFSTVMYLEKSGDLGAIELHRRGDLVSTEFDPTEIAGAAHILSEQTKTRISRVVYAHNHPSGVALHSPQDLRATAAQRDYLRNMADIELVESVVFGSAGVPYADGLQDAETLLGDIAAEGQRKRPRRKPLQRIGKEIRRAIALLHGKRLEHVHSLDGVVQYTRLSQETNECNGV